MHPRITMHFPPTSASWLNMVERFFCDITAEPFLRGIFTSVAELIAAMDSPVAHHNKNPKPYIWAKSARDIRMIQHMQGREPLGTVTLVWKPFGA